MKSADFAYHRPSDIADAVRYLQDYDGGARVLAGGQSLMPMMNMRLWRPEALIDINALTGLAELTVEGDETQIGALVRYTTLEFSPVVAERLPLLRAMVAFVGDRQVRNRGTIGGSLVQGDPTGEMPLGCLVLDATVSFLGPSGPRSIAMTDLYEGAYAATLAPDELLTEIRFPRHPSHFAFREFCRRHNDFCVLSVAATGGFRAAAAGAGSASGSAGSTTRPFWPTPAWHCWKEAASTTRTSRRQARLRAAPSIRRTISGGRPNTAPTSCRSTSRACCAICAASARG